MLRASLLVTVVVIRCNYVSIFNIAGGDFAEFRYIAVEVSVAGSQLRDGLRPGSGCLSG